MCPRPEEMCHHQVTQLFEPLSHKVELRILPQYPMYYTKDYELTWIKKLFYTEKHVRYGGIKVGLYHEVREKKLNHAQSEVPGTIMHVCTNDD